MHGRGPLDGARRYEQVRGRMVELIRGLGPPELATVVPATPAWSVHDVVAHVVGITADLNAERFDAADPADWTARQVAERQGRSVEDLVQEWDREAPRFEEGLRLFGYDLGSHYVGDLLQHLADVHHALGRGPVADDDALAVGLDFYLGVWGETLEAAAAGTVVVQLPEGERAVGTGPVVATLRAGRVDLFRALGGRRSLAQIRSMDWSGDRAAVVPLVSAYPPPPTAIEPG